MPLSWNEIRQNAIRFSKEWEGVASEKSEAKSFWDEFFAVFGLRRRLVATFEEPVKRLSGTYGYIDLFWPGVLLVEHKSLGKDLSKAETQACRYIQDLAREGRHDDCPRYLIVSDFDRIALYDLESPDSATTSLEFNLKDFHRHIHAFAFIPGYKVAPLTAQDPLNIKAAEMLGRLHDALEAGGFGGHELERFLVRVLFCLFAEDTGIFERGIFTLYVMNHTKEDGSDLGAQLARLFQTLDTAPERRQPTLDDDLKAFPYVNGELFRERLDAPELDGNMRKALLDCTKFDWGQISPAVFGALFQSVMEPKERRQIGAHYTSERDIMKVIEPLFLNKLRELHARAKISGSKTELKKLHTRLSGIKLFDPACGCGNFLIIAYRELRLLEIELMKEIYDETQQFLDIHAYIKVDVDQMFGIEIEEWPARIAEVALWLMDHQMNMKLSEIFGQYFVRLPLRKAPRITVGNALRLDWKTIIPPTDCSFILGNPPFVGKHLMNEAQSQDMEQLNSLKGYGLLDYVTAWYFKAADYIAGTKITAAFVSTNSIAQGEQVGALWNELFRRGMRIQFAYRTFPWQSEARGKAHVHCVIIGFAVGDGDSGERRSLYDHEGDTQTMSLVKNISPYLVEGLDFAIESRTKPLCRNVPEMVYGSKPTDDGNLIIADADKEAFLNENPLAAPYVKRLIGAEEYLHNQKRWCLWLPDDMSPEILSSSPGVLRRIAACKQFRLASKKEPTRKDAAFPTKFTEIRQPDSDYLIIPLHSSELRKYVPIGYFSPTEIVHNSCNCVPHATLWHFGVLTSTMHNAWMRQVCGRLKSDYRYSNKLVYNNYPWPMEATEKQKESVALAAQVVLDARAQFPDASLAALYNPLTMPPALTKAHQELDRAVERCYRPKPFENDRQRVEYLFELYAQLSAPLLAKKSK